MTSLIQPGEVIGGAMLAGIRILDLTREAGFLAGKILADLGAEVIKVEPPGGDLEGRRGPFLEGVSDPERSLLWLALNTSKRGITLALDSERGRAIYRSLVKASDVVLETEPPGALAKLGLDYESQREGHPGLIHCALTPFGSDGPFASYRAHDLVAVAMGGNAALTGDPDRPPIRCSLPTAYYHAGPEAALGIAMALFARARGGGGRFVDVSLRESQLSTLMAGPGQHAHTPRVHRRNGSLLGRTREIWKAGDGDITFGLRGGQARIPNLKATVDYMAEAGMAPDWLVDYDWENYNHNSVSDDEIARLEAAFGAFFATKTRRELYEQALARRIMLAPCNDAREILDQAQLRSRSLFTTIDYPEFGAAIEHPDFFAKSNRCSIGIRSRAPRIGEHNAEVFGEIGLAAADLAALSGEGVI